MRLLLALVLLLLPTCAAAQPGVVNLPGGYVIWGPLNEMTLVSIVDDPPGLRLGTMWQPGWGRGMGKISWNRVRGDLVQDEVALLQGKLDERFPEDSLVGELTLHLRTPPGGGDEGGMVHVATFRHDGVQFSVPVNGAGRFHHEGPGCWVSIFQDDGMQVLYFRPGGTTDERQWQPWWTNLHGVLPWAGSFPWPRTC